MGFSHAKIIRFDNRINNNTLRSLSEGNNLKPITAYSMLQTFIRIINQQILQRLQNGGNGVNELLKIKSEIADTIMFIN